MTAEVLGSTGDWTEDLYRRLYDLAENVGYAVHRQYPMAQVEDLTQKGLMWAIRHPRTLQGYLDGEDEDRSNRQIYGSMRNVCRDYAVKVRALERGDDTFIDDAFYSTDILKGFGRGSGQRGLLHYVFDDEAWTNPEKLEESAGRTKRDPAEGNKWLATLADVSSALDKLNRADPDSHALIVLHYKQGYTYTEIGASWKSPMGSSTVARRIDRAVKKVQEILGGPQPRKDPEEPGWNDGPGSRYVLTNAAARAITDGGYDAQ